MKTTSPGIAWPPAFTVKKHSRARHVKLKASQTHGLELVVPKRFNTKEIPSILETHRSWIEKQLLKLQSEMQSEEPLILPREINFQGIQQTWRVDYATSKSRLQILTRPDREIILLGKIENKNLCQKALIAWMKYQARSDLIAQLDQVSRSLNLPYKTAIIRDQSSRWGSCSSDKLISLNYKLLFLPPKLMEHVLIHELCHTVYLNHSDKFWQLVASFDPDWNAHKRELRHADKYIPRWISKI
ncbi:MAG: M48 family metallopeptidase [Gammaproteobacteria bacterium]